MYSVTESKNDQDEDMSGTHDSHDKREEKQQPEEELKSI
jgi:hypothetical protein